MDSLFYQGVQILKLVLKLYSDQLLLIEYVNFMFFLFLFFNRKDVFQPGLSTEDPAKAHKSNFLHPVIYFYKTPFTGTEYLLFRFFSFFFFFSFKKI